MRELVEESDGIFKGLTNGMLVQLTVHTRRTIHVEHNLKAYYFSKYKKHDLSHISATSRLNLEREHPP